MTAARMNTARLMGTATWRPTSSVGMATATRAGSVDRTPTALTITTAIFRVMATTRPTQDAGGTQTVPMGTTVLATVPATLMAAVAIMTAPTALTAPRMVIATNTSYRDRSSCVSRLTRGSFRFK